MEREGRVDVWWLDPREVEESAPTAAWRRLLTAEERERVDRMRLERDRHDRLVSRVLLRTVLSRYAAVPVEAWRFVEGEHGRPEVAGDPCDPPLRFNLSHTEGLIAVAVTRGPAVGVDVESTGRRSDPLAIARRYFAPDEVRTLETLAADDRRRRFLELWTLKEAYVKARGLALAVSLRHVRFDLDAVGAIEAAFDTELSDDPRRWRFSLRRPTDRHILAVAVSRPAGELPEIDIFLRRARGLLPGSGLE